MAKAEWGIKRTCRDCGARFYDLQRDPVPCPQCGAELALKAAPKRPVPLLRLLLKSRSNPADIDRLVQELGLSISAQ